MGAFDDFRSQAYPHRFRVKLRVGTIAGGTPSDPHKIEGWIRSKVADSDDVIRQMVAEAVVERGITGEEAIEEVAKNQHLNGFKRANGMGSDLIIEGRQAKAMLKEAASIAAAADKIPARGWGKTNKGVKSFLAEHVFVPEEVISLGVDEPTGINQRFVHTFRGNGIQYEEFVSDAEIEFTVHTDIELSDEQWAMIWLTGEENGLGASRSQGYGRFTVEEWERIEA